MGSPEDEPESTKATGDGEHESPRAWVTVSKSFTVGRFAITPVTATLKIADNAQAKDWRLSERVYLAVGLTTAIRSCVSAMTN